MHACRCAVCMYVSCMYIRLYMCRHIRVYRCNRRRPSRGLWSSTMVSGTGTRASKYEKSLASQIFFPAQLLNTKFEGAVLLLSMRQGVVHALFASTSPRCSSSVGSGRSGTSGRQLPTATMPPTASCGACCAKSGHVCMDVSMHVLMHMCVYTHVSTKPCMSICRRSSHQIRRPSFLIVCSTSTGRYHRRAHVHARTHACVQTCTLAHTHERTCKHKCTYTVVEYHPARRCHATGDFR